MDGPQRTLRLCGHADADDVKPFTFESSGNSFFDLQFVTNNLIESPGFQCRLTCKMKHVVPPTIKPSSAAPPTVKPPASCECGRSEFGRIIGGSETKRNQFVWQVTVLSSNSYKSSNAKINVT